MKKLFILIVILSLTFVLTSCSSILEPTNEHVTNELDESELVILDAIESLREEITKDAETIEVEVIVSVLEYQVCIIGSGDNKLVLENSIVTKKNFSDTIQIEFDGEYGRENKPFDTDDVDVECKNIY